MTDVLDKSVGRSDEEEEALFQLLRISSDRDVFLQTTQSPRLHEFLDDFRFSTREPWNTETHPKKEKPLEFAFLKSVSTTVPDSWTRVMEEMEDVLRSAIDKMFVQTALTSLGRRLVEESRKHTSRVESLAARVERLERDLERATRKDTSVKSLLPTIDFNWDLIQTSARKVAKELGWSIVGLQTEPDEELLTLWVHDESLDDALEQSLEFSARLIDKVGLEAGRRLSLEILPPEDAT